MINSVLNEGSRALQSSQREFTRVANDLVRNALSDEAVKTETGADSTAVFVPVKEGSESASPGGFSEPLVELKRQELLFNAAAEVVSTADQALGSLLDISA